MGFWDKFKRKKAVLVHEESQVISSSEENQPSVSVSEITSSAQTLNQRKPRKVQKRKKRVKKRRIMKKRAKPKHRTAMKVRGSRSLAMEDGTTTKKWLQKDREILGGALNDLNRELQNLRNTRKRLELKMANFSSELGTTQEKEISLRNKISALMKREATITKKKTTTKDKLALVDQKMDKVRAIQAELKNV